MYQAFFYCFISFYLYPLKDATALLLLNSSWGLLLETLEVLVRKVLKIDVFASLNREILYCIGKFYIELPIFFRILQLHLMQGYRALSQNFYMW